MGSQRLDFPEFYRGARDECLRTVLVTVGDQDAAQELVDEAFARACASWRKVSRHPAPAAWVVRTALNVNISRWRRRRREVAVPDLGTVADLSSTHGATDSPVNPRIMAALLRLPARQRQVVALRLFLDLDTGRTGGSCRHLAAARFPGWRCPSRPVLVAGPPAGGHRRRPRRHPVRAGAAVWPRPEWRQRVHVDIPVVSAAPPAGKNAHAGAGRGREPVQRRRVDLHDARRAWLARDEPIDGDADLTVTGTFIVIYPARHAWGKWHHLSQTLGLPVDAAGIRHQLATGQFQIIRRAVVDGHKAIELGLTGLNPLTGLHTTAALMWVDAASYLPLRQVLRFSTDRVDITDFRFLPANGREPGQTAHRHPAWVTTGPRCSQANGPTSKSPTVVRLVLWQDSQVRVELRGLEPLTPCLQRTKAAGCLTCLTADERRRGRARG